MTEGRQETREEEVARVQSYLASEGMRRARERLVEALREAHGQFLEATAAIPDAVFSTPPREGEWSAADVLEHVRAIAAIDESSIPAAIERGERPSDVRDVIEPAQPGAPREQVIPEINSLPDRLIAAVLLPHPQPHLDIFR